QNKDKLSSLSYLFGIGNIKCEKMSSQINYAIGKFPNVPIMPLLALAYETYGNHRIDQPNISECASHKYTNDFQLNGTSFGIGSRGGLIGNLTQLSQFLSKNDDEQAKAIAEAESKIKYFDS
ncbi:MAG: hypothetical protein RLZZ210_868, partial [Pseudomonadota bacterium]